MPFLGTIVNFFVVLVCGLMGLLVKKGIPIRVLESIRIAVGVFVVYMGIDGVLSSTPAEGSEIISDGLVKALVMLLSLALGTFIGETVNIKKMVERLGDFLEEKLVPGGEKGSFAEGFVYCSLLFCAGAMTINGAFMDAFGNPDILITKSVMDGIMCLVLAPTLGIGCAASSAFVLVYQGALTLVGLFLGDLLPPEMISYISTTGSLILILIGTNMIGATKVDTENMTPAIFLPALIWPIISLVVS